MESKLTSKEKSKKIGYEILDLLAGAAFPFMLMLILSATVIGYISYGGQEDIALKAVILVVGEVMLAAATFIFGKQNGASAYKKTVQNAGKRDAGSNELNVKFFTGEYALYKGIIIPLIACLPFIIVNLIYAVYPDKTCEFMLSYMFGWAYYPFALPKLSPYLNYILLIPYVAVHAFAYYYGGKTEKKKQEIIANQNEETAKRRKK
ncbi:MAG: hypothetical protein K2N30_03910 [Clostridia bacterium]|nr:hypothetical protein [Clostridia bacterium]